MVCSTAADWRERLGCSAGWAMGIALPLQAVGTWQFPRVIGIPTQTLLLLCGALLLLPLAIRRLDQLLRSPLLYACALLAVVECLLAFVQPQMDTSLRAAVRPLTMIAVVTALSAASESPQCFRSFIIGACAGGAATILVSLAGYFVLWGAPSGIRPFRYLGTHYLFPSVPRLSGTFGHSPQHFGEYLVFVMAAAGLWTGLGSRKGYWVLGLSSLALMLTFSWAWIGGLIVVTALVVPRLESRRAMRTIILSIVCLLALLGAWLVNFGLPVSTASRGSAVVDCRQADVDHHVTVTRNAAQLQPTLCVQRIDAHPYPHRRTLYAEAKLAAIDVFRNAPGLGVGPAAFRSRAQARVSDLLPGSNASFYDSPHCTYLGALALRGMAGGIALAFLLFALGWTAIRSGRAQPATIVLWAIAGFLVIGVNIDILAQRHLWALLGLAVGLTLPAQKAPRLDRRPRSG
jgi:hypothetical protein